MLIEGKVEHKSVAKTGKGRNQVNLIVENEQGRWFVQVRPKQKDMVMTIEKGNMVCLTVRNEMKTSTRKDGQEWHYNNLVLEKVA